MHRSSKHAYALVALSLLVALPVLPTAVAGNPCGGGTFGGQAEGAGTLAPGDSVTRGFAQTSGANFLLQVSVQTVIGDLGPNGAYTTWEWQDGDGNVFWWGWVKNYWSNTLTSGNAPSDTCFVLTNRSGDLIAYEFVISKV